MIGRAWSEFANSGDSPQQFVQRVELRLKRAMKLRKHAGAKEFTCRVVMALTQTPGKSKRRVAIARSGSLRRFQEGVGDLGHRTDDHDGLAFDSSFYDR